VVDLLLKDLAACVQQLLDSPEGVSGGSAPLYGMAGVSPDRGLVAEFLVMYQDTMLEAH
jgi:sphinganine-1-phosphate aldolase